jgi:hypothetical protein
MADLSRNRWPECFGTGGRNPSEQVAEFIGIGIYVVCYGGLDRFPAFYKQSLRNRNENAKRNGKRACLIKEIELISNVQKCLHGHFLGSGNHTPEGFLCTEKYPIGK